MANKEDNKLNYGFTFEKSGLDPNEFKHCLEQKVEKLLEHTDLERIKTLKTQSINEVKKLCMRKNTTRPGMDKRFKSVQENIDAGIIRDQEDTPVDHNKDSGGIQGQVKKQKEWHECYHELQHELFTGPLQQKIQTLFPTIAIKGDSKKKGYLFQSGKGEQELTAIQFCNVIDAVTYDLLKNLTALKERKPMPDDLDFENIYKFSEDIVLGRNAVDWVKNNDLMNEKQTQIWREHLMVVMSFAALMVISLMILSPRKKLLKRVKDFILAPHTVLAIVVVICAVVLYYYLN